MQVSAFFYLLIQKNHTFVLLRNSFAINIYNSETIQIMFGWIVRGNPAFENKNHTIDRRGKWKKD
jgi:hypothetical protein